MPDIGTVTAPLVIRSPDGDEKVVAACFAHPRGALYLDLFWHQSTPDQAAHIIEGQLSGDGPWKIADNVIRVLGCRNTDPHLQDPFTAWQNYLQNHGEDYPPRAQVLEIARRLGAEVKSAVPSPVLSDLL